MPSGILRIKIIGDASHLNAVLGTTGSKIATFGKMAGAVFLAAGVAVGVGIGASVKAFANFDAAMTRSLAIMGDVSAEMRTKMSDAAREVAKTTTFSATEAAEAFYFLASAGLSVSQTLGAMPLVAKFAQAGMMDMSRATELLADSQAALGLRVDDAAQNMENMARVADVLAKADASASGSIEQFGEALAIAAGSMRIVGMEVEEGVAILEAFSLVGIKGAEAGTQLSIVLRDLQTKAIQNKEAFEKFGVAVFDSEGNLNNMADIIGDLEVALEGMSDEQKKATLLQMGFSDKSIKAMLSIIGLSDEIREFEAANKSAFGTVEEISNKQLETFNAKLSILKSKLIDIGLSIGEAVMPGLMRLVDWIDEKMPQIEAAITGVIDWIANTAAPAFASAWEIVGAALEVLSLVFGRVWAAIKIVVEKFVAWFQSEEGTVAVQGAMERLHPILEALRGIFQTVWDAIGWIVDEVIKFITGPSGTKLIEGALEFLGAALKVLQQVFADVWPIIQSIVQKFIDFFNSEQGQQLIAFLVDSLGVAVKRLGEVWADVWPAMEVALKVVSTMIGNNLKVLSAAIWAVTKAIQALQAAYNYLKSSGAFSTSGNRGPAGGGNVTAHAAGGFINGPELALLGEAGRELVLPLTDTVRTAKLLAQAGLGGGVSGAPVASAGGMNMGGVVINIYGQGREAGEAAGDGFLRRVVTAGVQL